MIDVCQICTCRQIQVTHPFPQGSIYAVVSCRRCGVMWVDPMPTKNELRDFYRQYEHFDISYVDYLRITDYAWHTATRLTKEFRKHAGAKRLPLRFLDVGSGCGYLGLAMARAGCEAHIQDISPSAGHWLGEISENLRYPVQIHVREIDTMVTAGLKFDIINCSQFLEHVPQPWEYLRLLKEMLAPKGLLFIDVPNNLGRFVLIKNALRSYFDRGEYYYTLHPPEHIWGYTKESLRLLVESTGLKILESCTYGRGDMAFSGNGALWYPPLVEVPTLIKRLNLDKHAVYAIGKIALAFIDRTILSPFLKAGSGLAFTTSIASGTGERQYLRTTRG